MSALSSGRISPTNHDPVTSLIAHFSSLRDAESGCADEPEGHGPLRRRGPERRLRESGHATEQVSPPPIIYVAFALNTSQYSNVCCSDDVTLEIMFLFGGSLDRPALLYRMYKKSNAAAD